MQSQADAVLKLQPSPNGSAPARTPYHPQSLLDDSPAGVHGQSSNTPPTQAGALAPVDSTRAIDEPRGTKRKLTGNSALLPAKSPKRPSPPWKDFNPANPTVFSQDGKRKSGRVNALPLEYQPQGATRHKAAAYMKQHRVKLDGPKQRISKDSATSRPRPPTPVMESIPPTRPRSRSNRNDMNGSATPNVRTRQLSKVHAPVEKRKYTRRTVSQPSSLHEYSAASNIPDINGAMPSPPRTVKSLRLKLRPPMPIILSRWNIPPTRKYDSLENCFRDICETGEDAVRPLSVQEARHEALVWTRLEAAVAPGGLLHGGLDIKGLSQPLETHKLPPAPISHQDYLCAHVSMFSHALQNEDKEHRKRAKERAYQILEVWKSRQPKSELDLAKETRLRYRLTVCRELTDKWLAVKSFATQRKIEEHRKFHLERESQQMQGTLANLLKDQTSALRRRQELNASPAGGYSQDDDPSAELQEYALESDGDVSMDTSGAESDEDDTGSEDDEDDDDDDDSTSDEAPYDNQGEDFEDLMGDELRKRIYSDTARAELTFEELTQRTPEIMPPEKLPVPAPLPDKDMLAERHETSIVAALTTDSLVELEEVADELLDDEDVVPTDDDEDESEVSTSDTVGSGEDPGSDEEVSDDEGARDLWGFFTTGARQALGQSSPAAVLTSPTSDVQESQSHDAQVESATVNAASGANSTSDGQSGEETPATTLSKQSYTDEAATVDLARITPVSSLLRGTLREYQHQGMDWLAKLHANRENGILADEMGLGKTIQTISLLAHLATERGIWGPHLVVVPTSVMLNWEMEFKKFLPGFQILTYYGNQEERKEKRKGWMDDDQWNVCITSYTLAVADVGSLKRKNWHYMVLDEAHNIKNFQSLRWQTLLSFKTHSRLLLTGTPLQNNLTELWSLLAFLEPDTQKYPDLQTFAKLFNKPAELILDRGREDLSEENLETMKKLQVILRPVLLRRLKADVEKQMPKKYEHVVKCRLSKRQRQLYDGFMAMADTRASFASGNYMSIIGCLMQLRKVCNHPDLFETRQIVTSFAMPASAVADYEIKELLIRKRLMVEEDDLASKLDILNIWRENTGTLVSAQSRRLAALQPLELASRNIEMRSESGGTELCSDLTSTLALVLRQRQQALRGELGFYRAQTAMMTQRPPLYGAGLIQRYTFEKAPHVANSQPKRRARLTDWCLDTSPVLQNLFDLRLPTSSTTQEAIRKFGCVTPAVVAPGIARQIVTAEGAGFVHSKPAIEGIGGFHEAQTKLAIAFPDRSLLQYDCGKLQQLDKLLRQLLFGGHRALIFTQMVRVLDILEQFLNLHGHRYLRLDGATKIESRQSLMDQFNNDTRIPVFILSSRSGGIGINLTGADTVIFYDLDWNPAMDKQCQDRCHRIGQTRDVHIYRFVTEGTVEVNILRKSNQKRMLDEVVIQEGEFTTEAFDRSGLPDELEAETDAALDLVLGTGSNGTGRRRAGSALEQVEDQEDREAARQAEKEGAEVDVAEFRDEEAEKKTADAKYDGPPIQPDNSGGDGTLQANEEAELLPVVVEEDAVELKDEIEPASFEEYMLRFMAYELRDATVILQTEQQRKRSKKGKRHAGIARIRMGGI